MKMNFDYFQISKWIFQTVRVEKVEDKNDDICLVSMFPSWVMVLKLSKKCIFCNFVLTSAKNLRLSVKAIYIYASRSSHYTLSENDMVYSGLGHMRY